MDATPEVVSTCMFLQDVVHTISMDVNRIHVTAKAFTIFTDAHLSIHGPSTQGPSWGYSKVHFQ